MFGHSPVARQLVAERVGAPIIWYKRLPGITILLFEKAMHIHVYIYCTYIYYITYTI